MYHEQLKTFLINFSFPKDAQLRNEWTAVCGMSDVKDHHRVCILHFKPTQFRRRKTETSRVMLLRKAIPSQTEVFCDEKYVLYKE